MFAIQQYDINTLCDHSSITVKIDGYWSSDPIRLYVRRSSNYTTAGETNVKWSVDISHSSGGRDRDAVVNDVDAVTNFGHALIALAEEGRKIIAQADVLEANYQAKIAEYRRIVDERKKANAEKVESDSILGEERAKAIVNKVAEVARKTPYYVNGRLKYFARGNDVVSTINVSFGSKLTFKGHNGKLAKAEVIKTLAAGSIRTWFVALDEFGIEMGHCGEQSV